MAAVDEDEVDLLYHFRAELEGVALRASVLRGPSNLAPTLKFMVDATRRGVQEGNLEELAAKDLDFHCHIVVKSEYRTLARVWEGMDGPTRARLYRSFVGPLQQDLIHYSAESHRPVVDAVTTGDPDAAVLALKKHILETRSLIETGMSIRGDARWEDHA